MEVLRLKKRGISPMRADIAETDKADTTNETAAGVAPRYCKPVLLVACSTAFCVGILPYLTKS